jgi:hypothetical protein
MPQRVKFDEDGRRQWSRNRSVIVPVPVPVSFPDDMTR